MVPNVTRILGVGVTTQEERNVAGGAPRRVSLSMGQIRGAAGNIIFLNRGHQRDETIILDRKLQQGSEILKFGKVSSQSESNSRKVGAVYGCRWLKKGAEESTFQVESRRG